jgi:hypothetical protein
MKTIGHPESSCSNFWHHTVATTLQNSNANPQLRQQVMKHSPSLKGNLVITVRYTHTPTQKPSAAKSRKRCKRGNG